MLRRRLRCPVGSSSVDLIGVGRRVIVPATRRFSISPFHGEVAFLFALGGP